MDNTAENETVSLSPVEPASLPWSQGIVLICSKCSQRLVEEGLASADATPTERMKAELKQHIQRNRLQTRLRAVTTSCLNVCPEKRITVVTLALGKGVAPRIMTVDPGITFEELREAVFESFK